MDMKTFVITVISTTHASSSFAYFLLKLGMLPGRMWLWQSIFGCDGAQKFQESGCDPKNLVRFPSKSEILCMSARESYSALVRRFHVVSNLNFLTSS